jgi:hypothetical protein
MVSGSSAVTTVGGKTATHDRRGLSSVDHDEPVSYQSKALPGKDQSGTDICGPSCEAHIAKQQAAPRDLTGPLWMVGAGLVVALRRRKRAA